MRAVRSVHGCRLVPAQEPLCDAERQLGGRVVIREQVTYNLGVVPVPEVSVERGDLL